jgi:protein SCO1/2
LQHAASDAAIDRRWAVLGLAGAALALVTIIALAAWAAVDRTTGTAEASTPAGGSTGEASPYAYPAADPAPPLDLVNHEGQPFDLAELEGDPVLVFFGYTHCPDVCPTTIGTVNRVLGDVGEGPRVLFVSIDPERDTPEAMAEYVQFLPDAYIGLTGSDVQVRAAADGYRVSYAKVETGSEAGYAMAHTAELYLIDPEGRLRFHYPFGTDEEVIAADVAALLEDRS